MPYCNKGHLILDNYYQDPACKQCQEEIEADLVKLAEAVINNPETFSNGWDRREAYQTAKRILDARSVPYGR